MKYLFLLLIVISGTAVYGQSAKKLNKRLQAVLLVEEQKQDSVYRIFVQKRRILEEHRKELETLLEKNLSFESYELIKKTDVISRYLRTFEELQLDTKEIILKEFESADSFPDYSAFIKPYRNPLRQFVTFEFAFRDILITDRQEINEKNAILTELLQKYRACEKENVERFRELEFFTGKLTELKPRLDSLLTVYQLWNKELQNKRELLLKKYEEARENYRLKGPGGFPAAYREYFWDVHPLPGDEWIVGTENNYDPLLVVDVGLNDKIYSKIDESATYPDGKAAMMSYLRDNLVYPPMAKKQGITGRVSVNFVVSEKGEISDVSIDKGMMDCPECNEEAIRLMESMPRWIPAVKEGYYVKSYHYEVIWFTLHENPLSK